MDKPRFISGTGPIHPKVVIVGEAPGYYEDQSGVPFSGPSGRLLDSILENAGIRRSDCYVTNVCKYRPPDNKLANLKFIGVDLKGQIDFVRSEVQQLKPNLIIALGATALKAFTNKTNITNHRGSVMHSLIGPKLLATFHPAHVLHNAGSESAGYWQKYVIEFDIKKAAREASFPDVRTPKRNIVVCRSSLDLHRFIEAARASGGHKRPRLSVDIEAFKCWPVCIGLAYSPWNAISVPLFDVFNGIKLSDMTMTELATCWRMLDRALREFDVCGQNFKYDHEKVEMIGFRVLKFVSDTMLKMHTCYPELPQSLAFQTSIFTDEPYYKDEGKEFNPKRDDISQLLIYNGKDCCVTFEIDEKLDGELSDLGLTSFYNDYVVKLHGLYRQIEGRGFAVDFTQREILKIKYTNLIRDAQLELAQTVGREVNVNSPKQVADLLYGTLGLPKREDTSEDSIVALLANHCKSLTTMRALNLVLDLRRLRKTVSTYVNAKPDYDGRHRTSYRITGTETGRTSTNKLKVPVRPEPLGLAFQTLTKHGDIGSDIRSMLIADPGYILGETDLSQAEARIVALLSDDLDMLDLFDSGIDIHKLTYGIIGRVGLPCRTAREAIDKRDILLPILKKIDKGQRFMGKKTRHAGNYDMKKRRLMTEMMNDARRFHIDIGIVSEWRCGTFLDEFHGFSSKIKSVFHQETVEFVLSHGYLVNPFGRKRTIFSRNEENEWKEWYATIPQGTVPDHLRHSIFRILDRIPDLQILLEGHDAIVWQYRESEFEKVIPIIHEEMNKPIDFSGCSLPRGQLIIPSETQIGTNYRDLADFKISA